ncbi:MAG: HAD-IC family P-type ATPase, partial [Clostridia bacterium]
MDFFSNVGTDSKKAIENESLPQQVNTEVSSPENLDDNFSDIKIPKKITAIEIVERYDTDKKKGLTSEQVKGRYSEGLINGNVRKKGRSVAKIIFSNTFTFFNMIYLAFGIAYIAFAQWKQLSFLFVIVANTLIAIIQEIKSKRTLEKLNLVNSPTVKVIRDGKSSKVRSDSLVLDDIQILENGNQITADSVILEGAVEVNEAVLTGESESVYKKKGETLFAGSYITSSSCVARVDKIAKYNYIESLSDKAKMYRKPRSEMLSSLRSILIGVAIIVLPMMFFLWQTNAQAYNGNTNLIVGSENFIKTLNTTAGAIISMIPAGPFLLTSVALAVSVIRLAKHKTMVQELYCIEMLARVNVLCLDKTGTITDGTMRVVDCIDVRNETTNNFTIKEIMCALLKSLSDNNMTSIALKDYFGMPRNNTLKTTAILPFSSNRKLSAVSFGSDGTYILGAPEYVMKTGTSRISELTEKYAKEGYRVLLLAYSSSEIYEGKLPTIKRPVAVIVIEDHIRPDAGKTIDWFKNNGVAVK